MKKFKLASDNMKKALRGALVAGVAMMALGAPQQAQAQNNRILNGYKNSPIHKIIKGVTDVLADVNNTTAYARGDVAGIRIYGNSVKSNVQGVSMEVEDLTGIPVTQKLQERRQRVASAKQNAAAVRNGGTQTQASAGQNTEVREVSLEQLVKMSNSVQRQETGGVRSNANAGQNRGTSSVSLNNLVQRMNKTR